MAVPAGFLDELRQAVGAQWVYTAAPELYVHSYDFLGHSKQLPDAACAPGSRDEVLAVLGVARKYGVPVVSRGAGTGCSGGAWPASGGLVVATARLHRILELDIPNRCAVVEPGVINQAVKAALAPHGYTYMPDPGSTKVSTIGGNCAENAGGPHCVKYGVTTNHVLGLEVAFADGTVAMLGGKAEEVPGPDLRGLLIGSEGTLGIITQVILRITPLPPDVRTMLVLYDDLQDAMRSVSGIIARQITPAALELIDRDTMNAVEDYLHVGLPRAAECALVIEADGPAEDLDAQAGAIVAVCRENGARSVQVARTPAETQQMWLARRSAAASIARVAPRVWYQDMTVPRNHLAAMMAKVVEVAHRYDLRIATLAHAGDGNLHPGYPHDPRDADYVRRMRAADDEMLRLCIALGGSISGEHGIGCDKVHHLAQQFGPADLAAMQAVKAALDPEHLLNPGKAIPGAGAPGYGHEQAEVAPAWAGAPGLSVNAENLSARVPADMPVAELQAALAPHGLRWPVDGPAATVGAALDAAAAGPGRLRWGPVRDWVLGLTVVTPAGVTVRTGGQVVKNVAGYDLTRLLVGAHGAFGRLTEAFLRLAPLPAEQYTLVAGYADLGTAVAAAERLAEHPDAAALELLDGAAARALGAAAVPDAPLVLLARLEGSGSGLPLRVGATGLPMPEATLLEPEPAAALWAAQRDLHARLLAGGAACVQAAVPPAALMAAHQAAAAALGGGAPMVAHAGNGILRFYLPAPLPPDLAGRLERLRAAMQALGGHALPGGGPPGWADRCPPAAHDVAAAKAGALVQAFARLRGGLSVV